jgi:hypothetical protein
VPLLVACASILVAAAVAEAEPTPPAPAPPEKVTIVKPDPYHCGLQIKPGKCGDRGAVDYVPPRPLGPPLTRDEILTEMRRVEPDVSACGPPADVGGSVVVRLVISAKGRIVAATATGRFEGTPTGMCVEQKVKTVQFRGNEGLSLNYAFRFSANAASGATKARNDRPRWPKSSRVTGTEEQLKKLLGIPGVTVEDHAQLRVGPGRWQITVKAADQNAVEELQRRGFVLELHDPIVVDRKTVGLPPD